MPGVGDRVLGIETDLRRLKAGKSKTYEITSPKICENHPNLRTILIFSLLKENTKRFIRRLTSRFTQIKSRKIQNHEITSLNLRKSSQSADSPDLLFS